MISLSFKTVHKCDNKIIEHVGPCSKAQSKGLKCTIRSPGFTEGTNSCLPSAWGDENAKSHATLQDTCEEIQERVSAALEQELAQFEIYHRDGMFPNDRYGCYIL